MKIFLILKILILCSLNFYGQGGELGQFDCNFTKEITVPFNFSETQSNSTPLLNQVVFYSYRDQFSYWYKITVKQNEIVHFDVFAINDSDSYEVYIYQYNYSDFCNKLYNQKLKPLFKSWSAGKGSDLMLPAVKELNAKKDNSYYISVLNTSLNNCGHLFNLSYQTTDTLKIKALHLPCVKDVSALSVTKNNNAKKKDAVNVITHNKTPNTDTATQIVTTRIVPGLKNDINISVLEPIVIQPINEIKTLNDPIIFLVKDSKKQNLINAKLTVIDLETKDHVSLDNPSTGRWEGVIENNKKYKLTCLEFGYKETELFIDATKGKVVELLLEHLKIGDNFIMKRIYFHPNTYALKKESSEDLQKLLNFLLNNISVTIEIQGHTNGDNKIFKNKIYANLGEEWNFQGSAKKLSFKRAEAIKNYLLNNGVAPDRLIPEGYGGSKAIVKDPETMQEGQQNIRVEILILKN